MEDIYFNNTDQILDNGHALIELGKPVKRDYPILNECITYVSTVRTFIKENREQRLPETNDRVQEGLQHVKDLLTCAVPSTDSDHMIPAYNFDTAAEIEDLLGLQPAQIAPWATYAVQIIGNLQNGSWQDLPPEQQEFAWLGLGEFSTRLMEQTFGPRDRWPWSAY